MSEFDNMNNILSLKKVIQKKDEEIEILKHNIKYRDITINFYKDLIQSKLNIKLSKDIFEDDIIIHSKFNTVYKKKEKKIHKEDNNNNLQIKQNKKHKSITKKITKKISIKKKIPNEIRFIKEKTPKEIKEMIDKVNSKITVEKNSPTDKIWNLSFEEHQTNISNLLITLNEARNYGKYLSEIKYHRLHFLKFLDEEKYKKHVTTCIEKIKNIFKKRGSDEKKIRNLMKHKIINAYEHRMLMLDDFEKTNIDIDEVNLVKKCFEHKVKCKTQFEIFSSDIINQNICNYQLCISNVLTVISNSITNIYGFNNIIYLPFNNNNFAFYYLESITKNKRKWVMDCRLDDILNDIREKALTYCISIFRKIYQKIFHDNQYRADFIEVSQVMELEGIQLLKNIVYLNNYLQFVKDFQDVVKNCNIYHPSELDEFNLFTDDPLFKLDDKTIKIEEQMKKIFDNITTKESNELHNLIQKQK
jgi:hypothetical protein